MKALKIDDTLAEAHSTLGWVKFTFNWDWDGSEKEFKRASEINTNVADTLSGYATLLSFIRRHAEEKFLFVTLQAARLGSIK